MNDAAPLPPHRDPAVAATASEALATLRELCPSLNVALLLTDDGFEIARTPKNGSGDQRLSSMASSLQALSEAIARELALGAAQYALVEASIGRVLLRRIDGQPIVLAAVFDDDETVGRAISVSRRVVDDLAAALARPTTPVG